MNILYLVPTLDNYGASRTLYNLIRKTNNKFNKIWVLWPEGVDEYALSNMVFPTNVELMKCQMPIVRRGDIYSLRLPRSIFKWAIQIMALRKRIKKIDGVDKIDIIHCFTSAPILSGLALRNFRGGKLISVHEFPKNRIEEAFVSFLAKNFFDAVVCASNYVREAFHLDAGRVIHSGVDMERFSFRTQRIDFGTKESLRIVCVGRFNGWKGQDVLISSLSHLLELGVNAELDFFGTGFNGDLTYLNECIDQVSRLSLENRVRFNGEVNDISKNLHQFHVSVIPSKNPEPFGKVVVESMAAGLITVASRHGGPLEVLRNGWNGYLFSPNDAIDLAQILYTVDKLTDSAFYGITKQAHQDAYNFSDMKTAEGYLDEYFSLTTR